MAKKTTGAITDVFSEAQAAYEVRGQKAAILAEVRREEAEAIALKTAELDAVKAEHAARVADAQADADKAQAELSRLQTELQDFIGRPDPRVTVK